jgi:hypothetical protein
MSSPNPDPLPAHLPMWAPWPTLDEVAALEPRVWELIADAHAARRGRGPGWCPTQTFYRQFGRRIMALVGPDRVPADPGGDLARVRAEARLRRPEPHRVVYLAVHDTLHLTNLLAERSAEGDE